MVQIGSTAVRARPGRLAVVVTSMMLMLMSGASVAKAYEFSGHLPGKTWTTNGVYYPHMSILSGVSHTAGLQICVAPAEYSGGWSFPLGWTCGYEPVMGVGGGAYPAVDNPNSREVSFTVVIQ